MSNQDIRIDPRTATDVEARVRALLDAYAPQWQELDPVSGEAQGLSAALIRIFGRLAEIVIERLNQAPDKNFLAFLDLLGASRLPPQPARVPLTFLLAPGSPVDAQVPAGTPVAAAPAEGESAPVIFETERALTVSAARLSSVFALDPEQDTYGDRSRLLSVDDTTDEPVFQGDRHIEHVLYIGHDRLLGDPQLKSLAAAITLAAPVANGDARSVAWERWDGTDWVPLQPSNDATLALTQNGTVYFGAVAPFLSSAVGVQTDRWLRCRLVTPIADRDNAVAGMVRVKDLPRLTQIRLDAVLARDPGEGLLPDLAFFNSLPIDITKELYPFGEKPKVADVLYLASAEAFARDRSGGLAAAGASIELRVRVANPYLPPSATSVWPSPDLQLVWECWSGQAWQKLGTSDAPKWLGMIELKPLPAIMTDPFVLVSGIAVRGATLFFPSSDRTTATALASGPTGAFAVSRALTPGLNVLAVTATAQGRSASTWAVVFRGQVAEQRAQLLVSGPDSPVPKDSVNLKLQVTGQDATKVTRVRVTNGSAPPGAQNPFIQKPVGDAVKIPLLEGRNDLLLEGLGDTDTPVLAAATITVSRSAASPAVDAGGFADGTFGFCQSGSVYLRLPDTVGRTAVNGQDNFWLRVRIVRGDFGQEAAYVASILADGTTGYTLAPASFRPPLLAPPAIGYSVAASAPPARCVTLNGGDSRDVTGVLGAASGGFAPFLGAGVPRPALYLGFTLPAGRAGFPNSTLTVFAGAAEVKYGKLRVPIDPDLSRQAGPPGGEVAHRFTITNGSALPVQFSLTTLATTWQTTLDRTELLLPGGASTKVEVRVTVPQDNTHPGDSDRGFLWVQTSLDPDLLCSAAFETVVGVVGEDDPPRLGWEYWTGRQWVKLTVRDDSEGFTRPGPIDLLPPADIAPASRFGQERYWLRVQWRTGSYPVAPRLKLLLLNTTLAAQTVTVFNEILGSSDGSVSQRFHAARPPLLEGQQLEVREPEMPAAGDLARIQAQEGSDALRVVSDAAGRPREIWVRWHEVADFYGSGPQDRHYVLDHLAGELQFGNGVNGKVPPQGSGNLRLARYRTGGGQAGNRAAGLVTQLKTTVPYVDKVSNPDAAAGGAEAEALESLRMRAPRTLRHRDRAVTLEDYEDLAMLATPEVARSLCVPLRHLGADRLGKQPRPGANSVIVVPRTLDAKPLPSLELLSRVEDFLRARATATAELAVVGPLYLRVEVTAEIAVATLEGAAAVEQAVYRRLADFLHPLTGGLEGEGWDFGRAPHRSDFYSVIEAVPGVDHVTLLQLADYEDEEGVRGTGRFLVYSGSHSISLVFEQP